MADKLLLTKNQVAILLGVDYRSIHNYVSSEVDPLPVYSQGTGRRPSMFDATVVVEWHVARKIASKVRESPDGGKYDLDAERARLTRAQAERVEMANSKTRGELIPVDVVANVHANMITMARTRLLSTPVRAASLIAGLTDKREMEKVLRDLVFEVLEQLSEYDPTIYIEAQENDDESADGSAGETADDGEDVAPPNKPVSKRVGRRKSSVKPGGKRGAGKVANKSRTVSKGNHGRAKRSAR